MGGCRYCISWDQTQCSNIRGCVIVHRQIMQAVNTLDASSNSSQIFPKMNEYHTYTHINTRMYTHSIQEGVWAAS